MDAIKIAEKAFKASNSAGQHINFSTNYFSHERVFPFHQYETFWPCFSQPPQLPAYSTFSNSGIISEEPLLPKFNLQRAGSNKSNLHKTIPNTFSTREKPWGKILDFTSFVLPKKIREEFIGDIKETRQEMERKGYSKWSVNTISCLKVCSVIWGALRMRLSDLLESEKENNK